MQLEFDIAVESKACLQEFAEEVSEKVSGMADFKKKYMRFSIGVDQYLKQEIRHATQMKYTTNKIKHEYKVNIHITNTENLNKRHNNYKLPN